MPLSDLYKLTYRELQKQEGFDIESATAIETLEYLNIVRKDLCLDVIEDMNSDVRNVLMETENILQANEYKRKKRELGYDE